jgi:hypothetical protein
MGNVFFIWVVGAACKESILSKGLTRNLAPGVGFEEVFPATQHGFGLRPTVFILPELLSAIGQKYRRLLIWNEGICFIWIVAGATLLSSKP